METRPAAGLKHSLNGISCSSLEQCTAASNRNYRGYNEKAILINVLSCKKTVNYRTNTVCYCFWN